MSEHVDRILALIDEGLLEHDTQRSPEWSNEFPFLGPSMQDLRLASMERLLAPVVRDFEAAMVSVQNAMAATGVTFKEIAEALGLMRPPPVPAKAAHRRRFGRG